MNEQGAQAQSRSGEAELQRLVALIPDCLWSAEIDGAGQWVYRYISPSVTRITGRPPEFFLEDPQRWQSMVHPEDRPIWERAVARLRTGMSSREEYRVVWADGTTLRVRDNVSVSRSANGTACHLDGVLTDITEQKRAEESLRVLEQRYRLLFEQNVAGVLQSTLDGRILDCNETLARILGYASREEVLTQKTWTFYFRDTDRQGLITRLRRQAVLTNQEMCFQRKDGRPAWVLANVSLLEGVFGEPVLQGTIIDVSERRRAEESLRESEALYHSLVETLPLSVFRKDLEGRFTFVNQRFCEALGRPRDEIIGKTDYDFFPAKMAEKYRQDDRRIMARRQPFEDAEEHQKPTGERIFVHVLKTHVTDADGLLVGTQGFFWDITARVLAEEGLRRTADELTRSNQRLTQLATDLEAAVASERQAHEGLRKAQGQLVQSEKLAALGQLVAGVAHEINNPLAYVSTTVTVLQRDVYALRDLLLLYQECEASLARHEPERLGHIHEYAERIDLPYTLTNLESLLGRSRDGVQRIQQIVKDLKDFARVDERERHEADLNAGVESTLHIIRGQAIKRRVELEVDLAPLPPVVCYLAKINQVVLNLVVNAIDACPEGGKVTVRTCTGPDGVQLHVLDTGPGIDPAIRDKIFEPFFTTKPAGQGTGLGLSISYGIVTDHGGRIEVDSRPGHGTHFTVHLPLQPARS